MAVSTAGYITSVAFLLCAYIFCTKKVKVGKEIGIGSQGGPFFGSLTTQRQQNQSWNAVEGGKYKKVTNLLSKKIYPILRFWIYTGNMIASNCKKNIGAQKNVDPDSVQPSELFITQKRFINVFLRLIRLN